MRDALVGTIARCMVALVLERAGTFSRGATPAPLTTIAAAPHRQPRGAMQAANEVFAWLSAMGDGAPWVLFSPQPRVCTIDDDGFVSALAELGALDRSVYADIAVEQLGAAYEAMLGWDVVRADASSLLLRDGTLVNLESVAALDGAARLSGIVCKLSPPVQRAVLRAQGVEELARALARYASPEARMPLASRAFALAPSIARRRMGSHYTPPVLAARVVAATLGPLLDAATSRPLRVCDPAMGTGAFLLAAGRYLVKRMTSAGSAVSPQDAWQQVIHGSLYGVDADSFAVQIAAACLSIEATPWGCALTAVPGLRHGDALVGRGWLGTARSPVGETRLPGVDPDGRAERLARAEAEQGAPALHWREAFPEASREGGFDAMIGNPPWVAFAGRAAQPLGRAVFAWYESAYESFRGYRTLHGLFIERSASLLRPGGRLGLIVPTSVADLQGYEPVRVAHDRWCVVDDDLPDLGSDAFEGVFQPAVALLSTRLGAGEPDKAAATWTVARHDLDRVSMRLLERLAALLPVAAHTFAERGYQTSRADRAKLVAAARKRPGMVPLREGGDIGPLIAYAPRRFVDPAELTGTLRSSGQWQEVDVLVRQTARYPIAAVSDGIAFRNSILAGFALAPWTPGALAAYLNSWPVRWLHYMRFRDARQGMPQVKIAHLRATPMLPSSDASAIHSLHAVAEIAALRGGGMGATEQAQVDRIVADAWALTSEEWRVIDAFAAAYPVPARAARSLR